MPDSDYLQDGLKVAERIAKTAGAVAAAAAVVAPVVEDVAEKVVDSSGKKELIEVPPLYLKGFPVELDRGVEILKEQGFRVVPTAVNTPSIKFKNHIPSQIIETEPKQKAKVPANTLIFVKYIPTEIVERSVQMFEESVKLKTETRIANKIKFDDTVSATTAAVQEKAGRLVEVAKKNLQKIPRSKKKAKEETNEQKQWD